MLQDVTLKSFPLPLVQRPEDRQQPVHHTCVTQETFALPLGLPGTNTGTRTLLIFSFTFLNLFSGFLLYFYLFVYFSLCVYIPTQPLVTSF